MSNKKTIIYAFLVMLLWGSLFPMVKLGYGAYGIKTTGDILYFAGARFVVCGIIICLYSALTDRSSFKTINKSTLLPIILSGLIAITLHYGFTYTGLMLTDSSKTAILKQIGVLVYICFSFLFFKDDRPSVKKVLAALMGISGIAVINAGPAGVCFSIGDILIIGASCCTVISNVISKKVFSSVKPVTATGVAQLFGGIVLLAAGKMAGGSMSFHIGQSLLFICICLASVISYCIWYTVVKQADLSGLFIIKFSEPVFAAVFGALILNENIFKLQYLLAFILIGGSIFITNKKQ